jgi:hypothetical protein
MKYSLFQLLMVPAVAAVWWFVMLMETAPSNRSDTGGLIVAGLYHGLAISLTYMITLTPKTVSRPAIWLAYVGLPYWCLDCLSLSYTLGNMLIPFTLHVAQNAFFVGMHVVMVLAGVDLCWHRLEYRSTSKLAGLVVGYLTCLWPILPYWNRLLK